MPRSPVLKAETRLSFKRRGFEAILFAMVRPSDARAAAVNESTLTLTYAYRSIRVPLEDIKTVLLGRIELPLPGRQRLGRFREQWLCQPSSTRLSENR